MDTYSKCLGLTSDQGWPERETKLVYRLHQTAERNGPKAVNELIVDTSWFPLGVSGVWVLVNTALSFGLWLCRVTSVVKDLGRMCWLWQGFHGIAIDPIPITSTKSPVCKAYLLTPQSNYHKSLPHDRAPESGFVTEGGSHFSCFHVCNKTVIDLQYNHNGWCEWLLNALRHFLVMKHKAQVARFDKIKNPYYILKILKDTICNTYYVLLLITGLSLQKLGLGSCLWPPVKNNLFFTCM